MTSNDLSSLLFFAIPVGFIAYIFLGQRKRVRAMQAMQASIVVGEEVRTTSGLFGRVTALTDSEIHLEVAPGVVVCLLYTSPSPRDGLLSRMPSSA